jgi:hypothetical protein
MLVCCVWFVVRSLSVLVNERNIYILPILILIMLEVNTDDGTNN